MVGGLRDAARRGPRRSGRPVTLVEERAPGISNLSRAVVVHARTLEQLGAWGLADELARGGPPATRRLFDRLALALAPLPSRFVHVLVLPQYEVERALKQRAVEAGGGSGERGPSSTRNEYTVLFSGCGDRSGTTALRTRGSTCPSTTGPWTGDPPCTYGGAVMRPSKENRSWGAPPRVR
ncbi:FAD-dependent oxidoreductase [Streptomyces sp. NRRL S-920]|uniref:FAD-dependent oxidoreductase n=1 Tax=Streptomyces sp. NRRL S-920 TaxID=1463921 RepID=UPI003B63B812